jgi:DNA-binding beta-propeller fold protein YncE
MSWNIIIVCGVEVANAMSIRYLSSFGRSGTRQGEFQHPCGITTDASLNVYVADTANSRIQKFARNGLFWTEFGQGEGSWFSRTGKVDMLLRPTGIAVDAAGNNYVADIELNYVQKVDAECRFLMKFGKQGKKEGEFKRLRMVHLDADNRIWVVDAYNHRIQKFDSQGKFLLMFGKRGNNKEGKGEFQDPSDLAFDNKGCIYVTDTFHHMVQKFDERGNFLSKFGKWGKNDGEFIMPRGIAIDRKGRIYVVDTVNCRIQIFDANGLFLCKFGRMGTEMQS